MKVLTVICGAQIDPNTGATTTASLDEIIVEYTRTWDKVHLVGWSKNKTDVLKQQSSYSSKVYLTAVGRYKKKLTPRLRHFAGGYRSVIKEYLEQTGILDETDCIQFRFPNYFALMLAYGLRNSNVKMCFYMAGDEIEWIKWNFPYLAIPVRIKNALERRLMANRPIVTTGDVLAKKYQNVGPTHAYYSTTHRTAVERKPREEYFNCIFVGAHYESKRVIDVFDAMQILNGKYPKIQCTIVGAGRNFDESIQYIADNDLESMITICGYVNDRDELRNYYHRADFLITPSLSEGTPRVLPEAMSNGVIPIAIKNVGSNNYIITDGINGSLCEPKSPESIAKALTAYFEDRQKYLSALDGIYKYACQRNIQKEVDKLWGFVIDQIELRRTINEGQIATGEA